MVQLLKGRIHSERRKDLVSIFGKINPSIQEIGNQIVWKEKVSSSGLMEGNTKANGSQINYTIMESFHGQMAVYIGVNG